MIHNFNIRQTLRILGILLLLESFFLLISAGVALYYNGYDLKYLLYTTLITAGAGVVGLLFGINADKNIGTREGYTIVGFVWIMFSFFGLLPFYLSGAIPTVTDAFFETMSGFTTTGASILNDIEALPHGLLFWRSIIQWLGGMGIVVLSLAILPFLGGGLQLFAAEVPGPSYDKLHPRIQDTARRLWGIYLLITLAETILLFCGGMSIFDSVCHSFTTMSGGGFSTKQASIAYWDSPYIQYTITFFMFTAGCNFTLLYYAIAKGKLTQVWKDEEFRFYLGVVIFFTLIFTIGLSYYRSSDTFSAIEANFRESIFQTVSILTTTGYATADYLLWHPVLWLILLFIMPWGGSSSSTSGAIKMVRIMLVIKNGYYEFKRLIHPKAILPVKFNNKIVKDSVINNVFAFVVFYFGLIGISVILLSFVGMPIDEAVGGVVTSIGNVGPGLGNVGPAGNFANIPEFAKWYLSFLMLVGRLEIFTIIIIVSPAFWKR